MPHFMNLPCMSLQRTDFITTGLHFMNLPWASLQGAATAAEEARTAAAAATVRMARMFDPSLAKDPTVPPVVPPRKG
jgi:hypothetical protein